METENIIEKLDWIPATAGVIWVFLTILLLFTISIVRGTQTKEVKRFSKLLFLLIASCWLYPSYIFGLSTMAGFVGCAVTFTITIVLIYKLKDTSKLAASLVAPVMLWSVLASVYTFLLLF